MPREHLSRLFEPFTQLDNSTTRDFGGTGLGLAISRRFAQMLGGDVTIVDSAPERGTRVRVTVTTGPLEDVKLIDSAPECVQAAAAPVPGKARPSPTALAGRRILLAEDGADNQRLISFVLRHAGAAVTLTPNGELACEAALAARDAGRPFDVILLDMQMPVMDGYEAAARLRRERYSGPILALTAHAMEGDREKCLKAGCDDYATKPIDRAGLIATVCDSLRADREDPPPTRAIQRRFFSSN
jgi:CheY-like chemotaxis protein